MGGYLRPVTRRFATGRTFCYQQRATTGTNFVAMTGETWCQGAESNRRHGDFQFQARPAIHVGSRPLPRVCHQISRLPWERGWRWKRAGDCRSLAPPAPAALGGWRWRRGAVTRPRRRGGDLQQAVGTGGRHGAVEPLLDRLLQDAGVPGEAFERIGALLLVARQDTAERSLLLHPRLPSALAPTRAPRAAPADPCRPFARTGGARLTRFDGICG